MTSRAADAQGKPCYFETAAADNRPFYEKHGFVVDEVIELYQTISRELAECKQISLADERIEGNTAYLVYDQKDVCGNASETNEKHSVQW